MGYLSMGRWARAPSQGGARWTIRSTSEGTARKRRRLPEATQAGRDQAEINRPALGEQQLVVAQRRVWRAVDRLTHGSGAYHRCHEVDSASQRAVATARGPARAERAPGVGPQGPARPPDSGTLAAVADTASPCSDAFTSRITRLYGNCGILMSTDRLCLIEPTRLESTDGRLPPSVDTSLILRWTAPWPTERSPVATMVVEMPATDTGTFTRTRPSGSAEAVAPEPPKPDVFISLFTASQPRLVVPLTSSAVICPVPFIRASVDALTPFAVMSSASRGTPWLVGWAT